MDGTCFNSKQCKKFVLLFQLAHGSGTVSVKFLVFINPKGKTIDGTCCRPMVIGLCNPCDQFFEVCLNDPATRLVFIFSPLCMELHGLVQSFTSNVKLEFLHLSKELYVTVDFGEVKTAPTECKEKYFQMTSSAYFCCSKAPQRVLMLVIHLRKRSAR